MGLPYAVFFVLLWLDIYCCSIISGDLCFGGKVQNVLCHCFSAFSNTFYLWNTMVFIRYSSSFCAGVAPTDVLSFLFVLNNNKGIIILNALTPGGGTFLKLGLYLILFWKLLKLFSTRGQEALCFWLGVGKLEIKLFLLRQRGRESDTCMWCLRPWWDHTCKLESMLGNLDCREQSHLFEFSIKIGVWGQWPIFGHYLGKKSLVSKEQTE